MKNTSRPCFFAAGKPLSRLKVSVTWPFESVGASAGIENWLYGTAVT